jgi:arylsulfatase
MIPKLSEKRWSLVVLLIAGLGCGCGREMQPLIEIDLARLPSCSVGGEAVPVPSYDIGSSHGVIQEDQRPIDFFLRLPSHTALRFQLSPMVPLEDVRVVADNDERHEELTALPHRDGGYRAEMMGWDGMIVRIRFENLTSQPVTWVRPRITGVSTAQEPLLSRPPEGMKRPLNILLYVVDALRADHLSVYGYALPTSPYLEELSKHSAVFLDAYSVGSNTMHSIPSLFTSVYSDEAVGRLRPNTNSTGLTVAEVFSKSGYATAAFQANFWLRESLGVARGFDRYEIVIDPNDPRSLKADADLLHKHVLRWLERPREKPFFLYIQSMDVHWPYSPPPPFFGRFRTEQARVSVEERIRSLPEAVLSRRGVTREFLRELVAKLEPDYYDDCVAYADNEIRQLTTAIGDLGLRESTAIIITSDHGEALGEGGRFLHGLSLNEEQVRVPLIISLPWETTAARVDHVVSLIDLAPTLLDLAGIPIPEQFEGRSLLRPRQREASERAIGNTGGMWFIRAGPWKLLVNREKVELFHIPSDPQEDTDLSAQNPIRVGYLTQLLWENLVSFRNLDYRVQPLDQGLPEEERKKLNEALRALGYME